MLDWANQFSICCFLDDNQYRLREHSFECLLAVNAQSVLHTTQGKVFEQLQAFIDKSNDWCFGHLGYDLKNEIETLQSDNADPVKFDDIFFFVPEIVLILRSNELLIGVKGQEHASVARAVFN